MKANELGDDFIGLLVVAAGLWLNATELVDFSTVKRRSSTEQGGGHVDFIGRLTRR